MTQIFSRGFLVALGPHCRRTKSSAEYFFSTSWMYFHPSFSWTSKVSTCERYWVVKIFQKLRIPAVLEGMITQSCTAGCSDLGSLHVISGGWTSRKIHDACFSSTNLHKERFAGGPTRPVTVPLGKYTGATIEVLVFEQSVQRTRRVYNKLVNVRKHWFFFF